MPEFFQTDFRKLVATHIAECFNCFINILFQSLQVMQIVGIHNTFEFSPQINITWV
jgi:hypothetical protein